jgi:hypothetical protein
VKASRIGASPMSILLKASSIKLLPPFTVRNASAIVMFVGKGRGSWEFLTCGQVGIVTGA